MVSMNLWGFNESLFESLAEQFDRFRAGCVDTPQEEFLLGASINEQLHAGHSRVHVVDGGAAGFGMTYRADQLAVVGRIRRLIAAGMYPDNLRDGLT
jgi:hypothetical protein